MQFAIDENGIRTSINNSIKGKPYKCPCCGSEVIRIVYCKTCQNVKNFWKPRTAYLKRSVLVAC